MMMMDMQQKVFTVAIVDWDGIPPDRGQEWCATWSQNQEGLNN